MSLTIAISGDQSPSTTCPVEGQFDWGWTETVSSSDESAIAVWYLTGPAAGVDHRAGGNLSEVDETSGSSM
jgi:hypothetical protein